MPTWVRAGERSGGTLPPRMSVKASLESWLGFLEFLDLAPLGGPDPPCGLFFLRAYPSCMRMSCACARRAPPPLPHTLGPGKVFFVKRDRTMAVRTHPQSTGLPTRMSTRGEYLPPRGYTHKAYGTPHRSERLR